MKYWTMKQWADQLKIKPRWARILSYRVPGATWFGNQRVVPAGSKDPRKWVHGTKTPENKPSEQ